MKKIRFTLFLSLSIACIASAQITFNKRLDFGFKAAVLTSIVATDSCYYTSGLVLDTLTSFKTGIIFAKFDLEGNLISNKTMIDSSKNILAWWNTLTNIPDSSGFYLTAQTINDTFYTILLLRLTPEGEITETHEYFAVPGESILNNSDFILRPNGEAFILNSNLNPTKSSQIQLTSLNQDKSVKWQKSYGGSRKEAAMSIALSSNGNIFVGSQRRTPGLNYFIYQTYILVIDSLGEMISYWTTPNTQEVLYGGAIDMIALEDNSLVIASGKGYEEILSAYYSTIYMEKSIFKLSPEGEVLWEVIFDNPEEYHGLYTIPLALIRLNDGSGYVACGFGKEPDDDYFYHGWIGKVSAEGDSLWSRNYVGLYDELSENILYDIKETADGGFLLCGQSRAYNSDPIPQQAWLLKLDEYGCLVPGCQLYTSTAELEEKVNLKIYPNPASDFLNIYCFSDTKPRQAAFRIVNAQGQIIRQFDTQAFNDATFILPLFNYPAGNYFLQYLENGQLLQSKPFAIVR